MELESIDKINTYSTPCRLLAFSPSWIFNMQNLNMSRPVYCGNLFEYINYSQLQF